MISDCGAEAGEFVVFGFVAGVEGAEHEDDLAAEMEGVGDVKVDLFCRLQDGDVDGDHFGRILEGGLACALSCMDGLASSLTVWRI